MRRSAFLVVVVCALVIFSTVHCSLGGGGKGTVEVVTPNTTIQLKGNGKTITVKSGEKQTVTAGTYQTKLIRIVAYENAEGRSIPWTMEVRTEFGELSKVKVRSGQTTRIEAGPPFQLKAKTTVNKSGSDRTVDIDVIIVGQSGVNYSHEIRRGQTSMPAPRCRIVDRSNNVIGSGVLDYG